jgi:hypothetical protein
VRSELSGTMRMRDRREEGAAGAVIELQIPLGDMLMPP